LLITIGFDVYWNGQLWVTVGQGINSIIWSTDGKNWNGISPSIFSIGYGISWVAVGSGINSIAWSTDGKNGLVLEILFFQIVVYLLHQMVKYGLLLVME
jgi:hypothetical protein